ncbi:hypothetical protein RY831_25445 [Noviherbaspirillum sp. CPCC 100848]|uniref:Uncharacterized protein n=1 Tax=Noviherbaspirillum album TaxID=3080276 RepID=A0ABU6JGV2_9BURK|nr:hypothetical protein [Noviherbaspirillum sp. CPCC 100848]MEC4722515.1 hypothetical protein [Noviherbaspirillum sp. CPCC 100848]
MRDAPMEIEELDTDLSEFKFTPRRAAACDGLRHLIKRRMLQTLQRLFQSPLIRLPLSWSGTLLGIVWASPLTAFGVVLAVPIVVFSGHAQLIRGHTLALLVRGRLADFMLQRHPFGAMNAMAIGHVVIAEKSGLSSRVLIHELAHVRQAAWWGPLFPFAYLASSAWAALRGKNAYWHNRFEVAARKAEKHF